MSCSIILCCAYRWHLTCDDLHLILLTVLPYSIFLHWVLQMDVHRLPNRYHLSLLLSSSLQMDSDIDVMFSSASLKTSVFDTVLIWCLRPRRLLAIFWCQRSALILPWILSRCLLTLWCSIPSDSQWCSTLSSFCFAQGLWSIRLVQVLRWWLKMLLMLHNCLVMDISGLLMFLCNVWSDVYDVTVQVVLSSVDHGHFPFLAVLFEDE